MTTLTFTNKEETVLRAALQCYIDDRMMQVAEAEDSGSDSAVEFFERHAADAEALLKRIGAEQKAIA
jgi:hypothetical protein